MVKHTYAFVAAFLVVTSAVFALLGIEAGAANSQAAFLLDQSVGLPSCECNKVLGTGNYCATVVQSCSRYDDANMCDNGHGYTDCAIEQAPSLGSGSQAYLLNDDPCTGLFYEYACLWYESQTPHCQSIGSGKELKCDGFKKKTVECQ